LRDDTTTRGELLISSRWKENVHWYGDLWRFAFRGQAAQKGAPKALRGGGKRRCRRIKTENRKNQDGAGEGEGEGEGKGEGKGKVKGRMRGKLQFSPLA